MSSNTYILEIQNKPYPFKWLQSNTPISLKKSIYISLIYLGIVSISVIGIHIMILIGDLSKYTKFWLSLPFPTVIIFILLINKRYVSLIITALVGFAIILFSSFHFFITTNYSNIFSEICLFRERESFMFLPLWMINLYMVAFPSILILYELFNYYYLDKKEEQKKNDTNDESKN